MQYFASCALTISLMSMAGCKSRHGSSVQLDIKAGLAEKLDLKRGKASDIAELCQMDQLYVFIGNGESMGELKFDPDYLGNFSDVQPKWAREDVVGQLKYFGVVKSQLYNLVHRTATLDRQTFEASCWRQDVLPLIKKSGSITILAITDGPNVDGAGGKIAKDTLVQSVRFSFGERDRDGRRPWQFVNRQFWSLARRTATSIAEESTSVNLSTEDAFLNELPRNAYAEYLLPLALNETATLQRELEKTLVKDGKPSHFSQVHYIIKSHGAKISESDRIAVNALNRPPSTFTVEAMASAESGILFDHHGYDWIAEREANYVYAAPVFSPDQIHQRAQMFGTTSDQEELARSSQGNPNGEQGNGNGEQGNGNGEQGSSKGLLIAINRQLRDNVISKLVSFPEGSSVKPAKVKTFTTRSRGGLYGNEDWREFVDPKPTAWRLYGSAKRYNGTGDITDNLLFTTGSQRRGVVLFDSCYGQPNPSRSIFYDNIQEGGRIASRVGGVLLLNSLPLLTAAVSYDSLNPLQYSFYAGFVAGNNTQYKDLRAEVELEFTGPNSSGVDVDATIKSRVMPYVFSCSNPVGFCEVDPSSHKFFQLAAWDKVFSAMEFISNVANELTKKPSFELASETSWPMADALIPNLQRTILGQENVATNLLQYDPRIKDLKGVLDYIFAANYLAVHIPTYDVNLHKSLHNVHAQLGLFTRQALHSMKERGYDSGEGHLILNMSELKNLVATTRQWCSDYKKVAPKNSFLVQRCP